MGTPASGLATSDLANALAWHVMRHPDRVAVSARDGSLTYENLWNRSGVLARRLVSAGAGRERTVGLFCGRTTSMVVGIVGVLRSGAAYLPIAPEHPARRTRGLVAEANMVAVVTTSDLSAECETRSDVGGLLTVVADGMAETTNGVGGSLPVRSPTSLAYVLPTSGSTGEPKGVLIEDRNVLSLARAIDAGVLTGLGENLRIAVVAPFIFDASVQQVFSALLLGHTLVVAPERVRADGLALREFWAEEAIDVSDGTPSHLRMATHARGAPEVTPRRLLIGGDSLPRAVLRDFLDTCAAPGTTVINIYGVAECCVDSVAGPAEPAAENDIVPIGVELPETVVDLVDDRGEPVGDGETGEIRIRGPRVGRGYLARPELTASRFGELPGTGERYYRTGDLARRSPDGTLNFLGRVDRQVKLRGHRIEPAEIESAMREYRVGGGIVAGKATNTTAAPVACDRCLLTSAHPGVTVTNRVCDVCRRFDGYRDELAQYFGNQDDLVSAIRRRSTREVSGYDVLLLFSGGKDSSYALYQLLDLGMRVLAFTFDNGFISQVAFDNIHRITSNAGVDLEIGRISTMDEVFAESLRSDSTVCGGCFRGLTAMSTKLAVDRGIGVVATGLSRGQIVDTKLHRLFEARIRDPQEIDRRLIAHRKVYHARRDRTATLLALPIAERSLDDILFLDYFRYDDVGTAQVKQFLRDRDPLWAAPTDTGMCSTNCRINEVGVYVHTLERGYHNYAAPLSWDCRLGVLDRAQGLLELSEVGTVEQVGDTLRRLGYVPAPGGSSVREAVVVLREEGEPHLCGYFTASGPVDPSRLREYLAGQLPSFMVPARLRRLDQLPVTDTGKIDYAALPGPGPLAARLAEPPAEGTEQRVAEIWTDVLGIDDVDRTSDFFGLGGDSLTATIVAGLVQGEFGVVLSTADLFAVPTVADAAARIESAQSGVTTGPSAPDGTGAGGLVLLPDLHGDGNVYQHLVDRLGPGVHALTGRSVLGDGAADVDIGDLGARYAHRVTERAGPSGPRSLGGWSFGGTLALEVARRIHADGGTVHSLLVVDAIPPDPAFWCRELSDVEAFLRGADQASDVPPDKLPGELWRLLASDRSRDMSALLAYARAILPVLTALSHYDPRDAAVPRLVCVRAADSPLPHWAEHGWRRHCRVDFRAVTLPGDHLSVLRPPLVDDLAAVAAALDGQRGEHLA